MEDSVYTKLNVDKCYNLFLREHGVCLNVFVKYKMLIYGGECIDWCELDSKLNYRKAPNIAETKVIIGLNCWDILKLLEDDDNEVCNLLDTSFNDETLKRIDEEQAEELIQYDSRNSSIQGSRIYRSSSVPKAR
jgi:hypothetical protein